jgi:LytS/YehU family sensor histidine kinase
MVSKNNMDEAYRHISKFSRLLRSYIRSSRNRIISLDKEVTNLRNYIELQQVRFDGRFSYEIITSPDINLNGVNIPSLLLQPFVENAINHGLLPKKGNGNLKISFHLPAGENTLYCNIEDDGVGRKQSRLENEAVGKLDESYGDLLIKDLVRIFRVYEKMKIDIEYVDKVAPESGTTVQIRIKYLENGK